MKVFDPKKSLDLFSRRELNSSDDMHAPQNKPTSPRWLPGH